MYVAMNINIFYTHEKIKKSKFNFLNTFTVFPSFSIAIISTKKFAIGKNK
jgi:hypothetical protein